MFSTIGLDDPISILTPFIDTLNPSISSFILIILDIGIDETKHLLESLKRLRRSEFVDVRFVNRSRWNNEVRGVDYTQNPMPSM